MAPPTQDEPGYYVWAPPGKDVRVHVHLDVIDGLLAEAMRGFGAVPKRGAEVGGVLIGSIEQGGGRGDPTVVRVTDFESVACSYTRGPSYLLSEEEKTNFADVCERWQSEAERAGYAVGYYRSHTREGMSLATEDLDLLDCHFVGQGDVALLIKPLATKASPAGFFFREDGVFSGVTPLEFPFRRRELTGEAAPAHRPMTDRKRGERGPRILARAPARTSLREREREPEVEDEPSVELAEPAQTERETPSHAYAVTTPARSRLKGWMWIPLSFVFLLLGVLLGFQAALSFGSKATAGSDIPLGLTISRNGDDLTVKWNRESASIRAAQRGVLEIQDDGFSKPVDLDAVHLQTGSIIYHNTSSTVRFRLTVDLNNRLTVVETLDWKQ
jgi:hypothetical protein